jgi:hypothetical protein
LIFFYQKTKEHENKHPIKKTYLGEGKQVDAVEKPAKTFE